jgi:hypothetical protein
MANANVAKGLIPYRHFDGSHYNGSFSVYFVPANYNQALFIGDPVDVISGSNDGIGTPAVQLAVVGSPILGVMIGIVDGGPEGAIVPVTRDLAISHPALTAQYVAVCIDPHLIYMVQDDATAQARAPNLWAGRNANLVAAAGSSVTGFSGWQLAASTVAATNTLDLHIIRPLQQADNAIGTVANTSMNAKWLVKLNNLRLENLIAGI